MYTLTRIVTDSVGYVVQAEPVFSDRVTSATVEKHLQVVAHNNPGAVRNDDDFTHRLTFPAPNGEPLTVTYVSQTA
jgi:hypothetical protein